MVFSLSALPLVNCHIQPLQAVLYGILVASTKILTVETNINRKIYYTIIVEEIKLFFDFRSVGNKTQTYN